MIDLIFDVLPQIHGGGNHGGLGAVKGLEDFLTFLESLSTKTPGEIFAAFMPGISAMDNIHPLLVHFPIVLLTLFFITDTLGGLFAKPGWRHFATPLLYIGTLSAMFTVAAGFQAAYSAAHNDATHAIMLRHQAFGISVTVIALLLSLRRIFASDNFIYTRTYGHFALSALMVILLTLGADLGGLMVYQYGVAVRPVIQLEITDPQIPQHVHSHDSAAHIHTYDVNIAPDVQETKGDGKK
ncbi:DUF2231 domain-containing protein [Methyloprofundus sp.]|uniref:DUF2231 domain-containing protein n=1 Tax=Methyloprofundus sp. TaxID=2020875 RepID=UPI003D14E150